ncbi:DUF3000 domain-containing protein [Ornithinicoccus halotolerans]|uniref:DUF3000 domain-containing protein n=1 Tax=Ornithinicoccus halotolerans TaxID=1748220 RepID=UPI00129697E6|nr:DUF3000 domain-containing protein [Ornithinicoccus halotolerans]
MSRTRTGRPGATGGEPTPAGTAFGRALAAVRAVTLRPEVLVEEVPAPTRLAPHALALSGDVVPSRADDGDAVATGRFVLLHDPAAPEPWESTWRVVTYAKAQLEPEMGHDPVLGEVGWSWLTEALTERAAEYTAVAGTVTSVLSESFGALSTTEATVELEVRASWSPLGEPESLEAHLQAWGHLLCTIAGLPPLPEGVVALPGRRG